MKKERALELLETFPELTDKLRHEIESKFPHYIVFNYKKATCTKCKHEFDNEEISILFDKNSECCDPRYQLSHKNLGFCPLCGVEVEYLEEKYIHKTAQNIKHKWNYTVLLDFENRLYIRCFTINQVISRAGISYDYIEKQRYIFSSDEGSIRYGPTEYQTKLSTYQGVTYQSIEKISGKWAPRSQLTEPVFNGYMWGDNNYDVVGIGAVLDTYAKYSALELWDSNIIDYLKFWSRHKNAEYLLKSGFGYIVKDYIENKSATYIDWKQNDLRKMMRINSHEMRLLKQNRSLGLFRYLCMRDDHKDFNADELFKLFEIIGHCEGTFESCQKQANLSEREIYKYMCKQQKKNPNLKIGEYADYLHECRELKYNVKSSTINQPRNLQEAHMRTSGILAELARKADEKRLLEMQKANAENIKKRSEIPFICEELGLFIRIPETTQEIVNEGKALDHCVGGYAGRHNEGALTIAFVRTINKPDVPYYTAEITNTGKIQQCRGYRNNDMTANVKQFISILKARLKEIYPQEQEKKTKKKAKVA